MEHGRRRREKPSVCCTLAVLMTSFTALFTAVGLASAAVAHLPLASNRVHGRDAVLLYKIVRCAGLALAAFPYVVDLLLLFFLTCLWCCGRASGRPPRRASHVGDGDASKEEVPGRDAARVAQGPVDWDAIRAPTFEYLAEVIRALSREEEQPAEPSIKDDLVSEAGSFSFSP